MKGESRTHPRLTPRARCCPHTQVSLPTRGLQLWALPPGAKGFAGSSTQSPSKLLIYTNVFPSSLVTVLPLPPEVAPAGLGGRLEPSGPDVACDDGEEGEAERADLGLVRRTARIMPATMRANTMAAMRMSPFLRLDLFRMGVKTG